MLNNKVKLTDGNEITVCDFHMQRLPVAYNFKGKTDGDCVYIPECTVEDQRVPLSGDVRLAATHTALGRVVYALVVKPSGTKDTQRFCKQICSECMRNYVASNGLEVVEQNDAKETDPCSLCGHVRSIVI